MYLGKHTPKAKERHSINALFALRSAKIFSRQNTGGS